LQLVPAAIWIVALQLPLAQRWKAAPPTQFQAPSLVHGPESVPPLPLPLPPVEEPLPEPEPPLGVEPPEEESPVPAPVVVPDGEAAAEVAVEPLPLPAPTLVDVAIVVGAGTETVADDDDAPPTLAVGAAVPGPVETVTNTPPGSECVAEEAEVEGL
jgi:hypothetical protein